MYNRAVKLYIDLSLHQGINLCMLSIYRVFVAFPVLNSYVVFLNVLSLKASFFSVCQRENTKLN